MAISSAEIRPPSVPLVAHDPYFSIWSSSNHLADENTRHWTGAEQPLHSFIRVDGKTFRLMGAEKSVPDALSQTGLKVGATRTIYTFLGAGVEVTLTFTTPSLPDNIEVLSRPATYLTWDVRSTDGKKHDASVFFSADGRLAVNVPNQTVITKRGKSGTGTVLSIAGDDQPVLQKRGDNLRIDWGRVLIEGEGLSFIGSYDKAVAKFVGSGSLPSDDPSQVLPARDNVAAAFALPFGKVGKTAVTRHLVLAYDDEYSIQFMGHKLRPYWRRNGMDANGLLAAAERDYAQLSIKCAAFDREVASDLTKVGGADYAYIGALAYRQSFAAQKVVADAKGQPLMFSKENFSNGCIATVDVLYPAAPQMLLFSPNLMKASLVPIMEYAASSRWKWPFAPHDLGQYPKANGQVYGGGERTEDNQMPVEESGNMIILLAALAKQEGNAKFSAKYWPQLQKWANYLAKEGFDPASQLSTDDFAGHLAHNVNLSAKAIVALGAYAQLADALGKNQEASRFHKMAEEFAVRWEKEAREGDHYRLAFDQSNTWSQKYNLVWDRILGLNLFPASIARTEMDYYRTKMNAFGLPLDNRRDYTKLDWEIWTATLTGKRDDFDMIVKPIAKFLNETTDRIPMTDWYYTSRPQHEGFQARSVVGGVFIKMLDTPAWAKYSNRDKQKFGPWAAIPKPPVVTEVIPTAPNKGLEWYYTTGQPGNGWNQNGADVSNWSKGLAGFGEGPSRGGQIRTPWTTKDIYIRRDFELTAAQIKDLQLIVAHDDGAEVYINGVLAIRLPNAAGYEVYDLPKSIRSILKVGKNQISIHCHDDGGDKYIDAGFVTTRLP